MLEKKFTVSKPKSKRLKNKDGQDDLSSLPPIPEKRYFTIGEAASLCAVKPHVLRYWEQEFLQLKPAKRRGNRRYYQQKDVIMVRQIRSLLYENGFTIEGARAQLNNNDQSDTVVTSLITDLEKILKELKVEN